MRARVGELKRARGADGYGGSKGAGRRAREPTLRKRRPAGIDEKKLASDAQQEQDQDEGQWRPQ